MYLSVQGFQFSSLLQISKSA